MRTAIYLRVSSKSQDVASQEPELKAWAAAQGECLWYTDAFTGKTMDRPGWQGLWRDACAGRIDRIVVWRLDRLGRTTRGLVTLRDELLARKLTLVSLRDGLDLNTPGGRMMFGVLASVAEYETEVRQERQREGIAAAKAKGKTWGGRKPGTRISLTLEKERLCRKMKADGESIAAIGRLLGLARKTVYVALGRAPSTAAAG